MFGSKEEKSAKAQSKVESILAKNGLNVSELTDSQIAAFNAKEIVDINANLAGSGLFSFGSILGANAADGFIINMLKAQVRQNWILIRQNEIMIRELKKNK